MIQSPEMQMNPLKMVCGCPCGGVIENGHTCNPVSLWNAFVSVQLCYKYWVILQSFQLVNSTRWSVIVLLNENAGMRCWFVQVVKLDLYFCVQILLELLEMLRPGWSMGPWAFCLWIGNGHISRPFDVSLLWCHVILSQIFCFNSLNIYVTSLMKTYLFITVTVMLDHF